eukprot:5939094-Amphidinium_carterae.1
MSLSMWSKCNLIDCVHGGSDDAQQSQATSPFVRIMLAPSAHRRKASPRLRQPHTKGTSTTN